MKNLSETLRGKEMIRTVMRIVRRTKQTWGFFSPAGNRPPSLTRGDKVSNCLTVKLPKMGLCSSLSSHSTPRMVKAVESQAACGIPLYRRDRSFLNAVCKKARERRLGKKTCFSHVTIFKSDYNQSKQSELSVMSLRFSHDQT